VRVTKEIETQPGFCQCGRPLHYSNRSIQAQVDKMISLAGEPFVTVTILGVGRFRVQRHYIALHGFNARVAIDYGFEKAQNDNDNGNH
jgi:hypothetical protein